jgi:hypothetical protein
MMAGATTFLSAAPKKLATHKSGTALIVAELEHAKTLLEKADHDYEGHRAKAHEETRKAIHALTHHHAANPEKKAEQKVAAAAKPAGAPKLPQEESDKHLREALTKLKEAEHLLAEHKGGGEHHVKAMADVKSAIHEVHTALKIK